MSDFISLGEIVENNQSLSSVKEELFEMKCSIKNYMDKGLSSEEMAIAKREQEAVLAAENILEKIANNS